MTSREQNADAAGTRQDEGSFQSTDAQHCVVVIQRNPASGSGRGRGELRILASCLRQRGYRVRMFSDRDSLDVYVARLPAVRSLRCIVAAGGDGTVADLVNRHPGVPLTILPLGTENLVARYLGLRRCGRTLADIIDQNQVCILDSALANGVRFLLMLSVGVDAQIVDALHSRRRGNIWKISYIWPGLMAFMKWKPCLWKAVSLDGLQSITGSHIIVTNLPRYGFGLRFAPNAAPDDQLLDVRAFRGTSRWQLICHALRLIFGLPDRREEISRFTTTGVSLSCVENAGSRLTQCDGDPGPTLPVVIRIDPRSLRLIMPPQDTETALSTVHVDDATSLDRRQK